MNLLIQNENLKIYKRKRTWVLIAIVALFVLLQIINLRTSGNPAASEDWRVQLEQENSWLTEETSAPDALNIEIRQAEKQLLLNQYHLDHGIPPQQSGWNFAVDQVGNVIFAISLIAIIIAGEIVAAEFASGTIKLLLTRSASRTKIYCAKYIASILFGFALALFGLLLSILLGGLIFGFGGLDHSYLYVSDSAVGEIPLLQALLGSYLFNLPFMVLTVTLAFMISAAFRSTTFSIVISLLASVAGFVIAIAMNGWDWTKYFVFSHTDLTPYIWGDPPVGEVSLAYALVFVLIHLAIMHMVSYTAFVKRDVT
ncbi:ABC transporter permease [Paenibacillus albidus]|uniref:ABC transporter permease subunit n=1 Tax=Paenibacillus albidus TaxID=2041023 RepID=UPI001BE94736|nr:ABC transporter permease subunit [Paenibacillus albidus]MBT2291433.1 ABC transporter permease [Paenibacillus albidus]